MLQVAAAERPGEPVLIRPIERERLTLERREQLVRAIRGPVRQGDRSRAAAACRAQTTNAGLARSGTTPALPARTHFRSQTAGWRSRRPKRSHDRFRPTSAVYANGSAENRFSFAEPDCGIQCCRRRRENPIESRAVPALVRSTAGSLQRAARRRASAPRHACVGVRRCAWGYTIAHLARRVLPAGSVCHSACCDARRRRTRASCPSSPPSTRSRRDAGVRSFSSQAALEAWNYNPSHEELFGLVQGVTYGLRDGLVLMARQRLYYVSQRQK